MKTLKNEISQESLEYAIKTKQSNALFNTYLPATIMVIPIKTNHKYPGPLSGQDQCDTRELLSGEQESLSLAITTSAFHFAH